MKNIKGRKRIQDAMMKDVGLQMKIMKKEIQE